MQNHSTATSVCRLLWQLLHQFQLDPQAARKLGSQVHRHCPTNAHWWSYLADRQKPDDERAWSISLQVCWRGDRNKCLNLLSNACGIMPLSTVKRWSKEARVKITVPCPSLIQSAYRRPWSFRHAGTPGLNPSQGKPLVHSSVWIHPWPVHPNFLAGLQEGLWPTEGETNASQKIQPGTRP